MKKSVKIWILQAPAILLLIISFIVTLFVKVSDKVPVRILTSLVILIIIIMFFLGKYYENKKDFF